MKIKFRNPIGRPPVKRTDIWPLLILVGVNFITSGTASILQYHFIQHPEKELNFWTNWLMPFVYWFGWTMLTYGAILAWRVRWLDNVILSCLNDIMRWREALRNKKSELIYTIIGRDDPFYVDSEDSEAQNNLDEYDRERKKWRLIFAIMMTTLTLIVMYIVPLEIATLIRLLR